MPRRDLADAAKTPAARLHVRAQHLVHLIAKPEIDMADDPGANFRSCPAPLRLGKPELDALVVREPDLAIYDEICAHRTKDPGEPPNADQGEGDV